MTVGLVAADGDDGVRTITIASPANRNALSGALIAELHAAIEAGLRDRATQVLVLTATGGTFCAGADLAEIHDHGGWRSAGEFAELLASLSSARKPTVARVNGHVRGGGLGLVAACDLAVAPAAATFAFPEVRLGLTPALIAVTVLPRMDSRAASRYLLTGETFDAAEAARVGLLTAGTDDLAGTDALVDEMVAALRQGTPEAQAATKDLLDDMGRAPALPRLAAMQALTERLFASPEAQRRIRQVLRR